MHTPFYLQNIFLFLWKTFVITCWSLSLRRACEEGLIVACEEERERVRQEDIVWSLWYWDALCNLSFCSHASQCDSQISAENSEERSGTEVKRGRSRACDAAGTNTDTRCSLAVLMWSWPALWCPHEALCLLILQMLCSVCSFTWGELGMWRCWATKRTKGTIHETKAEWISVETFHAALFHTLWHWIAFTSPGEFCTVTWGEY